MENCSIVLIIMSVMIEFSAIADKIHNPCPVLLIAIGIAIGFISSILGISINPEVVFLIFLPPMLYTAAFNINFNKFRTHFNTISTQAIGLVFLLTTRIAVAAYYLLPGMTWPLALYWATGLPIGVNLDYVST